MLRAVIIDDELHCRDRIIKLLENHSATIEIMEHFDGVESALQGLPKIQPDVVFLDVHLHDQTGFDLLRQLVNINFEIIFVTAYDKYAINAFKFSAIDYLLKPIDGDELSRTIDKLKEKVSARDLEGKMATLFHNLELPKPQAQRIAIPTTDGLSFIQIEDIIRCEADVNYTHLFMKDARKFTVSRTLKSFEELLEPYNFLRVHNSHLINLSFVEKYNKGKGGFITMTDKSEIEVSVRKKEVFLKKVMA